MTHNRYILRLTALILSLSLMSACDFSDPESTSVTFMAGYKAQANLPFVAAYIAQEKGFFEEQGLKVDIRHSTGEHVKLLLAGSVEFTTSDASAVLKLRTDPGVPIVAFALFGQKGQQAFISLEETGLQSVKDWEGKTFGYKISVPPEYLGILEASGVSRSKITEVKVGFDPRVLSEKRVDILAIFKSNEPDTLRKLGFPVQIFDPADHGVPTLGLTYITTETLMEDKPEVVQSFLKATMKGLDYAFNNIDEALDIVLKYADQEDREHMRYMLLTEMNDAISETTAVNGLGWMTKEQWRSLQDLLLQYQAIPERMPLESVYSESFLSAIYDDGVLIWP